MAVEFEMSTVMVMALQIVKVLCKLTHLEAIMQNQNSMYADAFIPELQIPIPDECPDDPYKTVNGICGCKASDVDSDSDGTPNCHGMLRGIQCLRLRWDMV